MINEEPSRRPSQAFDIQRTKRTSDSTVYIIHALTDVFQNKVSCINLGRVNLVSSHQATVCLCLLSWDDIHSYT